MAEFFVSTAMGLEEALAQEILECLPFCIDTRGRPRTGSDSVAWPEMSFHKGGVSLDLELEAGFQLNNWLKTANRILLRIAKFPAKSPTRLHERLKAIDIKSWIGSEPFELQIDAHECAVHNEKWIHRLATDFWPLVDRDAGPLRAQNHRLFLRGEKDEWVLSLDTSGEHLHKRGDRPKAGAAPLRETLAAATLRALVFGESRHELGRVTLMDPMAGTGSFLREGRSLYLPNLGRPYSYETLAKLPKIMKSEDFWKNLRSPWREEVLFGDLVGGEIDPEVFPILQKSPGVRSYSGDSLQRLSRSDWGVSESARLWMVLNPPYGERIKDLSWLSAFPDWARSMKPEKLAIWLPVSLEAKFLKLMAAEPAQRLSLSNGGIPCRVLIFSDFC